ncbi:MAG TPA: helix-turn-helix domain-containing protein [Gemmataceae bacterium]|jgi:excisionase family DNA binding protein|nr:helix-turn-helix domain-containing protein [Gemmataceae bacterium]
MIDAEVVEAQAEVPSGAPEGATKKKRRPPAVPNQILGLQLIERLAETLGLPLRTLKRLAREGGLPCVRLGNRWYFDPEQVAVKLRERADKNRDGEYRFD